MKKSPLLSLVAGIVLCGGSAAAADFYVNAYSGDDVAGDGSAANPWRTLTHAVAQGIAPGDVIHVAPGIHNPALGEIFPIAMPTGATIQGDAGPFVTVLNAAGTGDVVALASDSTLRGLTIRGSSGGWWNGGAVQWTPGSNLAIEECVFRQNQRGVHLWTGQSSVVLRNCFFSANGNDALSVFGSSGIVVLNCTFSANLKGMIFDGSSATVKNCIVTGSAIAGIQNSAQNPSTIALSNNDVFANAANYDPPTLLPGPGSISVNPSYAFNATGDLHIVPASPCVNAGAADPLLPSTDIDGDPRVAGTAVDMGADERGIPDFLIWGIPNLGAPVTIDLFGLPSTAYLLFAAAGTASLSLPPYGTLLLDPATLNLVASGGVSFLGAAYLPVTVPNNPSLVGGTVYFQSFGAGTAGYVLSGMRSATIH